MTTRTNDIYVGAFHFLLIDTHKMHCEAPARIRRDSCTEAIAASVADVTPGLIELIRSQAHPVYEVVGLTGRVRGDTSDAIVDWRTPFPRLQTTGGK